MLDEFGVGAIHAVAVPSITGETGEADIMDGCIAGPDGIVPASSGTAGASPIYTAASFGEMFNNHKVGGWDAESGVRVEGDLILAWAPTDRASGRIDISASETGFGHE